MAEFASKGVAGAGLGTGIAGLALGALNSSNNGNGLLGGLLGGGNQNVVSALQAENYSDKNAKEVYMQSLTDNRRLRDETFAYLKPLADESANNRVELAKLQAELKCCCEKQELREQIVLGKVNELALTTQAKFGCLDGTIANMMGTLGKITDTIVPMSAICPTPMAKHKLLEAIEKRNKEPYHTEGDIRAYKDALKALYYLISIEKSK